MMEQGRHTAQPRVWTYFGARLVVYTTLVCACAWFILEGNISAQFIGKGLMLLVLMFTVPTILSRLRTFIELAAFYLMVVSYFYVGWIWPSKYLIFGLDEVCIYILHLTEKFRTKIQISVTQYNKK